MSTGPRPISSVLDSLISATGHLSRLRPVGRVVVICHPESFRLLSAEFPAPQRDPSLPPAWMSPVSSFGFGVQIREDVNCPRWHKKWKPPASSGRFARFWEYGPEDEQWAAKIGIGRYVDDETRPWFMELTHPKPLAAELPPEWTTKRREREFEYGVEVRLPASIYMGGIF